MRLVYDSDEEATDDNGNSPHKPAGARPVTDDGRLLWVGPILPHQHGEFFLDGVNLGDISLERAKASYRELCKS